MKALPVCLLSIALAITTPATPAWAHVFPRAQTPAAGAKVTAPAQVRVVFDGPLEAAFSSLFVTDAEGRRIDTAKAVVDSQTQDTMTLALPVLSPGKYTVHWVAVADDGHRTQGDYAFEVK
jgi:copper resistance protein C